ncbi:MAG TPA: PaaX family transcriptional regulator C-terminal domain-containing protein [Micromonosporaceae bacterium]|nr:PaaX family transcriptional regulator C-terminal domain-containing protein [Micromonosporaceae bacterium]
MPARSGGRRVPTDSARWLLLTVLGEFVLPGGRPVWTATFVDVMAGLGVEPTAARQALARTATDGWLESTRSGRRTQWRLTDAGERLLRDGARRIYGFAPPGAAWDGRWLVLLVSVPESRRQARHVIRTRLAWAGFGSPAPGVWICAHADAEAEAKEVLAELGLADDAYSFVGPFAGIGSPTELVARAWDLSAVASHYQAFGELVASLRPTTPVDTMLAQIRLVHAWRRMPMIDPQLPADLLPPGWVGRTAAETFRDRHDAWRRTAQSAWSALLD